MAMKNDKGRLTPEGVAYVREQKSAGRTYQSLAEELGVCLTTIYNTVKRRTHGKR